MRCVALAVLVVAAACGQDPSLVDGTARPRASAEGSATASTGGPAAAAASGSPSSSPAALSDRSLIRSLWIGWSEAWEEGPGGGADYLEENNYPPYQKDSDLCRRLDEDRGVQRKVFAYDDDTIKRDDGWTIPEGSQKGRHPAGRIYSMDIRQLVTSDDGNQSVHGVSHISIDGGKAFLFQDCRYFFEKDSANR